MYIYIYINTTWIIWELPEPPDPSQTTNMYLTSTEKTTRKVTYQKQTTKETTHNKQQQQKERPTN